MKILDKNELDIKIQSIKKGFREDIENAIIKDYNFDTTRWLGYKQSLANCIQCPQQ